MFITALFTIARTWKQPRHPSTDEWIKKLWYIYTMEYYSVIKRNVFESVPMKWMNLEPITEWSKSEREIQLLYTNAYIWNLENWSWIIYLQGSSGETDIENRLMDMGRGEERVRCIMETYIIVCKIDSQWEYAVWLRKLKQGLCINLEGWDGVGDARKF